jgi:hypothetical protein
MGTHEVNYVRSAGNTIEGSFDETMMPSLPRGFHYRGRALHQLHTQLGIITEAKITQEALMEHNPEPVGPGSESNNEGFVDAETTLRSTGQISVKLVGHRMTMDGPAGKLPFGANGALLPGYVASTMEVTSSDIEAARLESDDVEHLSMEIETDMQDILENPRHIDRSMRFESAHRVLFFVQNHPQLWGEVEARMGRSRNAENGVFIDFVIEGKTKWSTFPEPVESDSSIISLPGANDPTYPHSKSKDWSVKLGSHEFYLFAEAGYFAGTNFDCKHEDLNWKLAANARAGARLFHHEEDAFNAEAVYAVIAGGTVENRLRVKLWHYTLLDQKILPDIPACPPEVVKTLWSIKPGFSVQHTVVVGVVPVTFSAGISAQIDLKWGYFLCPQNMQARVDLRPSITISASAGITVHAPPFRAGISLSGSMNQEIRPTAAVNGNLCQFGVNIHRIQEPKRCSFDGWWQHWECTVHKFKPHCGWSGKHDHPFWKWEGRAEDHPIWGELCQVSLQPFRVTCQQKPW